MTSTNPPPGGTGETGGTTSRVTQAVVQQTQQAIITSQMELEKARELSEIEELDKAEWNLHCEQYGGEEVGIQACYDFLFALDWE